MREYSVPSTTVPLTDFHVTARVIDDTAICSIPGNLAGSNAVGGMLHFVPEDRLSN